jgi:hypothetical protein
MAEAPLNYTTTIPAPRTAGECRDWLEAQLALIAARMATIQEVMLPYLHVGDRGLTLWEEYRQSEQAALPPGGVSGGS